MVGRRPNEQHADEHQAGDDHRLEDRLEIAQTDVAPPLLVEAERREDRDLADDHECDRRDQQILVAPRNALIEPKHVGQEVGKADKCRIDQDLNRAMPVDRIVEAGGHPAAV